MVNRPVKSLGLRTFIDGEFTPCRVEIKDGRIAAVFSIGEDECGEGFLIPSFTEAHLHLVRLARTFDGVDLRHCRDNESLLSSLHTYAKATDTEKWIIGGAFNANLWKGALPKQEILNENFPQRPVVLKNIDLHSGLLNACAISHLDCQAERGFIYEEPFWEAEARLPLTKGNELEPLLLRAVRALNEAGITAVQSFDGKDEEQTLSTLSKRNDIFTLRVMGSRLVNEFDESEAFPDTRQLWSRSDGSLVRFSPGPLKLFVDGALNSQTALLEHDYENEEGKRGIAILQKEELFELVKAGNEANRPVAVHAIGDLANRWAVEAFEALPEGSCKRLGHRIEHAQLLPPGLEQRMAKLDLAATTLPPHLPFDIVPALKHWGKERSKRLHVFRSMVEAGVTIALTSDAPVAPFSPLDSLRIAIFRKDLDGETFHPEECLTARQALDALTRAPAKLLFGENHWGQIKVGRAADLAVLSHNPLEMQVDTKIKVEATIFEGQLIYGKVYGGNA